MDGADAANNKIYISLHCFKKALRLMNVNYIQAMIINFTPYHYACIDVVVFLRWFALVSDRIWYNAP